MHDREPRFSSLNAAFIHDVYPRGVLTGCLESRFPKLGTLKINPYNQSLYSIFLAISHVNSTVFISFSKERLDWWTLGQFTASKTPLNLVQGGGGE